MLLNVIHNITNVIYNITEDEFCFIILLYNEMLYNIIEDEKEFIKFFLRFSEYSKNY